MERNLLFQLEPDFFSLRHYTSEAKDGGDLDDGRPDDGRPQQLRGPVWVTWGTDWRDAPLANSRALAAAVGGAPHPTTDWSMLYN